MTVTHEPRPAVTLRGPEDVLALIPHQLGRAPRNEVVLFLPGTDTGALCLVADHPPHDAEPAALGETLVDSLAHVRVGRDVLVVLYCDDAHDPAEPGQALLARAALWWEAAEAAGLSLMTVVVVGPTHWWDVLAASEPLPVERIERSPVNAQMVADGSGVEPPLLAEDPRWAARLEQRAGCLSRTWAVRSGQPVTVVTQPGRPGQADHTVSGCPALAAWERVLTRVGACKTDWVEIVLDSTDDNLLLLLDGLGERCSRDALYYSWLCGESSRAVPALVGLRAAVQHMTGASSRDGAPPAALHEALMCVTAVAGEWDGPPEWERVESAQRVLQVLDGLLNAEHFAATASLSPCAQSQEARAIVAAALAQVEYFRGRAHTGARLLERRGVVVLEAGPGQAVRDVLVRLHRQPVPWWCADPSTAWPGPRWWDRGRTA